MKKWLKIAFITGIVAILFSLLALGALVGGLGVASYKAYSNHWDNGDLIAANNSVIYDRYGKEVTQLHGPENRINIAFDRIPLNLRNAFLAVEDVRFYDHPGMDVQGIIRALLVDIRKEQKAQGASTITQQLARNAFLSNEKTWQRKLKELVMARELEKRYSKDEIFNLYLNRIYFGHGVYGVQAASKLYFGKDVSRLNLSECALLAGIPRNPNQFSPVEKVELAKERRGVVIGQMAEYGMITPQEAAQADEQPIRAIRLKGERKPYSYYIDQVIKEAEVKYGIAEKDLYQGGYRIYTGLDPTLQSKGEALAADSHNFPPGTISVECGIAVVDYVKGEIRVLVGGRGNQQIRGFNRATQLRRQPGSAIKPLVVYAPALEAGYPLDYQLNDNTQDLQGYEPDNAGGSRYGTVDMWFALKHSVNIYAVKMLQQIGVEKGYQAGLAMGLPLAEADRNLSLALGGLTRGVSPLQLAAAYGTLGADGVYREPLTITRLVDRYDLEVKCRTRRVATVFSTNTARMVTAMLQEVVNSGTGKAARLSERRTVVADTYGQARGYNLKLAEAHTYSAAGKTGTVQLPNIAEFKGINGNKDVWFAGYTPQVAAVVWMGFDHTDRQHYLKSVEGGDEPAKLWSKLLSSN